jgi:hypothetical protein
MGFTKRLHAGIMAGDITCTVRIWQRLKVKVGGRYGFPAGGQIEVTGIRRIDLADITPDLARRTGLAGVVDLPKVAKHGAGENIYLIDFAYQG